MWGRQPHAPQFHLVLLPLELVLLALALMSWFAFELEGDSVPLLSSRRDQQSQGHSNSEGISQRSPCQPNSLQASNPIFDGTCPFDINQPKRVPSLE